MKVVTPDWVTKSVEAGKLLRWQDFLFRLGPRIDEAQGKRSAQLSLAESFGTQRSDHSTQSGSSQPIGVALSPDSQESTSTMRKARPLPVVWTTDPVTLEQANRMPAYASSNSNAAAAKMLENPEWRSAHTSVSTGFVDGYYKNSRLHHLSMWRTELQELVRNAYSQEESIPSVPIANGVSMRGEELAKPGQDQPVAISAHPKERVIMHCDFDCFFVSAGLIDRPQLRGKPVVVCHSQGKDGSASSTSEIASSSYEARKFGIKNGMRCVFSSVLSVSYA